MRRRFGSEDVAKAAEMTGTVMIGVVILVGLIKLGIHDEIASQARAAIDLVT